MAGLPRRWIALSVLCRRRKLRYWTPRADLIEQLEAARIAEGPSPTARQCPSWSSTLSMIALSFALIIAKRLRSSSAPGSLYRDHRSDDVLLAALLVTFGLAWDLLLAEWLGCRGRACADAVLLLDSLLSSPSWIACNSIRYAYRAINWYLTVGPLAPLRLRLARVYSTVDAPTPWRHSGGHHGSVRPAESSEAASEAASKIMDRRGRRPGDFRASPARPTGWTGGVGDSHSSNSVAKQGTGIDESYRRHPASGTGRGNRMATLKGARGEDCWASASAFGQLVPLSQQIVDGLEQSDEGATRLRLAEMEASLARALVAVGLGDERVEPKGHSESILRHARASHSGPGETGLRGTESVIDTAPRDPPSLPHRSDPVADVPAAAQVIAAATMTATPAATTQATRTVQPHDTPNVRDGEPTPVLAARTIQTAQGEGPIGSDGEADEDRGSLRDASSAPVQSTIDSEDDASDDTWEERDREIAVPLPF